MEKTSCRVAVFGFVLAVVLQCSSAQTVHIVGDSVGWTVRQNFYGNWAANNNFAVGDILTFNFATNEHDVLEVPKESYDACSSDNPIGSLITTGPANISLTKAGDHFYICTVGRHCLAGQKLAITVSATAGAPSPRSSTPRTTPTTPSPAGEEACPPPEGSPTGAVHIVGDSLGWTVRQNLYGPWAANNNFAVGDILTFNFATNEHDVLEVPKESYDACSSDNPIGALITTGPANISLTKAGDHFYICTVGRHCVAGQKLAITVSATAGAPSPHSFTPRTTPTTPSPAGEEACPPPEGSPTGATLQPPPPPSSSAGVGASRLLTVLTITVFGWLL